MQCLVQYRPVAADDQQVTLLGLMDSSAAFECDNQMINHSMLLKRLWFAVGRTDSVFSNRLNLIS